VALFSGGKLSRLKSARALVRQSIEFVDAFAARQVTASEYPALVKRVLGALKQATAGLKNKPLTELLAAMVRDLGDVKRLQRRHWEFLLALDALVRGPSGRVRGRARRRRH
jgi:ABC-type nitrate/sulfonate/bicarbonate transport system substrate-binding protein